MKPVVYIRGALAEEEERVAAAKHFHTVGHRGAVPPDSLVIARYSALPFYDELVDDLGESGSKLLNSKVQHDYTANLRNWYYDLGDVTPRTWFALDQIPKDGGPFVLKGATNSKKFLWDTCMYAEDYPAAVNVFANLCQDQHIGYQPIYVRQYVPLNRLLTGLNGLPISEEYRFFILDGEMVAGGFYWQSHVDDLHEIPRVENVPGNFLDDVIKAVGNKARFWVVDIARTEEGKWIVIELNDGQQSGLSTVDPDLFYGRLKEMLA